MAGTIQPLAVAQDLNIQVPAVFYSHIRRITLMQPDEIADYKAAQKLANEIEFDLFRGKP